MSDLGWLLPSICIGTREQPLLLMISEIGAAFGFSSHQDFTRQTSAWNTKGSLFVKFFQDGCNFLR